MAIVLVLFISCLLTVLIELIPAAFMPERKKWMKTSIFCNVITNPVLNLFMFVVLGTDVYLTYIMAFGIAAEIVVAFSEAYIYKNMIGVSWKKSIKFSFAANSLSFVVGSIVMFFVINILLYNVFATEPSGTLLNTPI